MECVISHPDLQGLRAWVLVTQDAHGLYHRFGFSQFARPEHFMELHKPDMYSSESRVGDRPRSLRGPGAQDQRAI